MNYLSGLARAAKIVTPKSNERASRHWAALLLLISLLFVALATYGGYVLFRASGDNIPQSAALSPVAVETIEREKLQQILEEYRIRQATYEDALTQFTSVVDPSR